MTQYSQYWSRTVAASDNRRESTSSRRDGGVTVTIREADGPRGVGAAIGPIKSPDRSIGPTM